MISIIIPTYNRSVLLLEAVKSVLRQNYGDFEVVIIDDGSTDNTLANFRNFQETLPPEQSGKIKLLTQPKSGAPTARNYGFQSCVGDFVIFMDSDDLLTTNGVTRAMAELEISGADYVYLPVQNCNESGTPIEGAIVGSRFDGKLENILGYHWQTMGAIYRRKLVVDVGPWNPELTGSQDWEYQARVKLTGARGAFVNEVIGYWRTHASERIGASGYNYQYVLSVEKACLLIHSEAVRQQAICRHLRLRLVHRLVIHAVEAGTAGSKIDRDRLLKSARSIGEGSEAILAIILGLCNIRALDQFIYKRRILLRSKQ